VTGALHFLSPGPLATPTGGFRYDREMVSGLAAAGRLSSVIELADRFPLPDDGTVERARAALAALADGDRLIVDGLGFAPLLEPIAEAAGRLAIVAVIHHPLADETGLPAAVRARLLERERRALALARHVVVTSRATGLRLAELGVPPERVSVVAPGVDRPARAAREPTNRRRPRLVRLLSVGSLTPRKGHDVLLRALARLRDLPWRLWLVGAERDRRHARRLRTLAAALGLAGRIDWLGTVSAAELERRYRTADVFVLPSRLEGYGIVFAEAMAAGLPVIAAASPAVSEVVPADAGRLVAAGDDRALAAALAATLGATIRDPALRARLGAAGPSTGAARRSWDQARAEFLAAIELATVR
jgi:glycosyltransferase involved in cell wall biosynthesis